MKKSIKLGLVASALMTVSGLVFAQATDIKLVDPRESPYVIDPRGVIVKDPFGLCWRTGFWTPAAAAAPARAPSQALAHIGGWEWETARDHLYFPEHLAEGIEPHKTAEIWYFGAEHPDRFIDITDTFDDKINALMAHVSQVGTGEGLAARMRENPNDASADEPPVSTSVPTSKVAVIVTEPSAAALELK